MYEFNTTGVCAKKIRFDISDNKVHSVEFQGGCNGNLKAISVLVEGMEVEKLNELLKGIDCGGRGTSCSDQLVKGVNQALSEAK